MQLRMFSILKFNFKWAICALTMTIMGGSLLAQQKDPDAGKTVAQVEKELLPLANTILNDTLTDNKIEANKVFITRLTRLLQRPESYDYGFDSLQTISRLFPQDNSFRIFTWFVLDKPSETYFSESAYYYFGLVQRKFIDVKGKIHYLVIPLMELEQSPKGLESLVTDNLSWFGALYYKPKDSKYVPSYDGFYYKLEPKKGELKRDPNKKEEAITFIPGKYRSRTVEMVNQPKYSNYKRVKTDQRYYLLMGWNGWDNKANYKVAEILSFDSKDSTKINFGAPIFYFDNIPKARALFKYSDYSSFTMNYTYVKSGLFKLGKKRMLVYDHLAPPGKGTRPTDMFELGPDGSYDALNYFGKYGGYFEWYRDVTTTEKYDSRKHAREMAKLQEKLAKGDQTLPDYDKLASKRQARIDTKVTKREAQRQKKETERKLKESGIDIKKNRPKQGGN
jgi:hypothetical protein